MKTGPILGIITVIILIVAASAKAWKDGSDAARAEIDAVNQILKEPFNEDVFITQYDDELLVRKPSKWGLPGHNGYYQVKIKRIEDPELLKKYGEDYDENMRKTQEAKKKAQEGK